jgi:CubicO group peptidase (beta-lactamase class C family)
MYANNESMSNSKQHVLLFIKFPHAPILPVLTVLIFVAAVLDLNCLAYRYVFWNFVSMSHAQKFPSRHISSSDHPYVFPNAPARFDSIEYSWKGGGVKAPLDKFLVESGTTSFIVIKNDSLRLEWYRNGYSRKSIVTSFSAVKSVVSLLIGIALDEGTIRSVDDKIGDYISGLHERPLGALTIKKLLRMEKWRHFDECIFPWCDVVQEYYSPDAKKLTLNLIPETMNEDCFYYNDYNTKLLGYTLAAASGMTVSDYLAKKLWQPLGMEYDASWSLDNDHNGNELMSSGLNGRAIDFAKIGQLVLHNGYLNGRRIVSEEWIRESTRPDSATQRTWCMFQEDQKKYRMFYKYHWWGFHVDGSEYESLAWGTLGELIYISRGTRTVIVRFGEKTGNVDSWSVPLRFISKRFSS